MKYTVGLDIGIASVGWAVINNDKGRIEDLGVRIFKKAEEADGKALNQARREARGARRRIRRRATRMRKIKELFIKYNVVTEKQLENLYQMTEEKRDVWELRKIALDERVTNEEWVRILTTIAKRRGYKSNRKTDEEEKEVGKLSKGTQENRRLLEEKGYRTIGEMFYEDSKFESNKRNKAGEYNNTVLRSMLLDEVETLFEAQRKFGNEYASKELEEEFIRIMTYQKDFMTPELLERMLGKCTFEKTEPRAPKNSYTFERFMLLQKINNLKIYKEEQKCSLTLEERELIKDLAYNQAEIKYSQLRKKLNLSENDRFADLTYWVKNKNELTDAELVKKVEDTKFIKLEGWHKIRLALKAKDLEEKFNLVKENPDLQNAIADALVRNKTDDSIREYLKIREIDPDIIEAVLSINFTKFGHLSYKAMEKIIPELEKGETYDKACENVGYEFKGKKNQLQQKLPPLSEIDEVVLNPVVLRAVSQTRKVVNAIIDKYGSPIAIHIETARELSKSFDERRKIATKQKENFDDNEKIKEYIRENYHFEPKPFDIVKMKLWRQQGGKSVYSQKPIPAERLYEENFVQVDHIIPFSRSFDDSYNNKVLVLTDENQRKKEKTPYEYMGENEQLWHAFEEYVNITYKNNFKKKENLLMKKFNEEKSKEWIARNLNDTKYIARFMYNYINNNLAFAESELKRKVYNINGQATDILRHYWGLKKDRAESDKHHAMDAVVIACATNKNIKRVAEYSKWKVLYGNNEVVDVETGEIIDLKYNTEIQMKEPWPKFREELMARMSDNENMDDLKNGKFFNYDDIDIEKIKPIFVSRMPERKITGKAHKDTMRSKKFIEKGYKFTVVKKSLKNITKQEIESIVKNEEFNALYMSDKKMYDDIYEKMQNNGFKSEKAFAEPYYKPSDKAEKGALVRSIKVPSLGISGVTLEKNKSIAENDNMVRVDVFEKDQKYYLIPVYISDFTKNVLPNRVIKAHKSENEWPEINEEYLFKFSLYPNDLVKVKKKQQKEIIGYYKGTDRATGAIDLISHDGAEEFRSIGVQNLQIFKKYQVDVLGNVSEIKKEKREGVK